MSNGDPSLRCWVLITTINRLYGSRYFPSLIHPRAIPGRTLSRNGRKISVLEVFSSFHVLYYLLSPWGVGEALFLVSDESGLVFPLIS
ncbi:hypothetical protein CDAR_509661 [Caerostris darwini]|uniref:Uncharacterized protein n=1 Tax=Caerostris darwini TaxID=1538125 RepID=A0AAV4NZA1_9ARAC|nr:hypothetical protein CDAR_509661 [Caerostris darwini]